MKKILLIIGVIGLVFLFGCTKGSNSNNKADDTTPSRIQNAVTPGSSQSNGDQEIKTTSKGVKYLVDPNKIVGGGPPKDGIPSIDNPQYVTVEEADDLIIRAEEIKDELECK